MPATQCEIFEKATGHGEGNPSLVSGGKFRNHHQGQFGQQALHVLDGGGNQIFGAGSEQNLNGLAHKRLLAHGVLDESLPVGLECVQLAIRPESESLNAEGSRYGIGERHFLAGFSSETESAVQAAVFRIELE